MKKKPLPSAMDRAVAFREINSAYASIEQAAKQVETARLLYPDCPPKYYDKIYNLLTNLRYRIPTDTSTWEF